MEPNPKFRVFNRTISGLVNDHENNYSNVNADIFALILSANENRPKRRSTATVQQMKYFHLSERSARGTQIVLLRMHRGSHATTRTKKK